MCFTYVSLLIYVQEITKYLGLENNLSISIKFKKSKWHTHYPGTQERFAILVGNNRIIQNGLYLWTM